MLFLNKFNCPKVYKPKFKIITVFNPKNSYMLLPIKSFINFNKSTFTTVFFSSHPSSGFYSFAYSTITGDSFFFSITFGSFRSFLYYFFSSFFCSLGSSFGSSFVYSSPPYSFTYYLSIFFFPFFSSLSSPLFS